MNQDQIAALKAAAENAISPYGMGAIDAIFRSKALPETILALLAERDTLIARAEAAEKDAKLLDWIGSQGNSMPWLARQSLTGRGFRLHQDREGDHATAREAISAAMQQEAGE